MTCIAWDGTTLAADRQSSCGGVKAPVTKLFRVEGCLLGLTGDLSVGMEMVEWFRAGAEPKDFPASNKDPDKGCSMVCVRPDGSLWKYESGPYPFMHTAPCAFGSGDLGALVAMSLGCSASEAVTRASEFTTSCGLGIDTMTL